jgi:NADH:ubiquinone oxidoreductase subunit F (NADH-binding)
MANILTKIKQAGLVGRGGACFPTATKWAMVKDAPGDKKYVICNASEGEPGVKKDGYILQNLADKVINGINLAIDFLSAEKGIIYINHNYHKKFAKKLNDIIGQAPIKLFIKPIGSGYVGGEESSVLNAIEGKRVEPRLRPPFPTTVGLRGCPTLINNVETFLNVSLVAAGKFKQTRFYTVSGDCLWDGVYELPDNYAVMKVLKETNNYPKFPFFVQVGGDASGEVLNEKQLRREVSGAGSIKVYSTAKYTPKKIIQSWLNFFIQESCGQCTPCREGIYRLVELLKAEIIDWRLFNELLDNLEEASSCGLGCVVPIPIKSYIKNVLVNMPEDKLFPGSKKVI